MDTTEKPLRNLVERERLRLVTLCTIWLMTRLKSLSQSKQIVDSHRVAYPIVTRYRSQKVASHVERHCYRFRSDLYKRVYRVLMPMIIRGATPQNADTNLPQQNLYQKILTRLGRLLCRCGYKRKFKIGTSNYTVRLYWAKRGMTVKDWSVSLSLMGWSWSFHAIGMTRPAKMEISTTTRYYSI